MATKDQVNVTKPLVALNVQTISSDTTTDGNIIDTQGFEAATFIPFTGTLTDGDYTVQIEESDNSNFSDENVVADADLIRLEADASFTTDTDDNDISIIGYVGGKRYVRLSIVSTNTATNGATVGAICCLGCPHVGPVVHTAP